MKSDGGLRQLYRKHLTNAQWTAIETGATAGGVPDSEFCFPGGNQGWIENKLTRGWAVRMRPAQIGWLMRRSRMGGKCFIGVRRINKDDDEFWLFDGKYAMEVAQNGLANTPNMYRWCGGPLKWNWQQIEKMLTFANAVERV